MSRHLAETRLPPELLAKASLRGHEYAWPPEDIPRVIGAARDAGLLNVGGQLQLRIPGATCEAWWIEVDTYKLVPKSDGWKDRVMSTAAAALAAFEHLRKTTDFRAELRSAFPEQMSWFEASDALSDAVCFVWYVTSEEEAKRD